MTIEHRIESKLPLDAAGLLAFRVWHTTQGRAFRAAHDARTVNSVYLDSPSLDDYADNLDGMSIRAKLRLRWYGDTTSPGDVRVEAKRKRGGTSEKEIEVVEAPAAFGERLATSIAAIRSSVRDSLRVAFDDASHATLWNRYRREYFETREGLRLTLDTDLRAADIVRDRLETPRLRASSVHAVVELKFPADARRDMEQLLASMPLRVAKHSKYASGLGRAPW